jgi:hypothetical protein
VISYISEPISRQPKNSCGEGKRKKRKKPGWKKKLKVARSLATFGDFSGELFCEKGAKVARRQATFNFCFRCKKKNKKIKKKISGNISKQKQYE